MTDRSMQIPTTPCDCCGSTEWTPAFDEKGYTLGRCEQCGLYYVSPLPSMEERIRDMSAGHYADESVAPALTHLQSERNRTKEFERYIDAVQQVNPDDGPWLGVGCGTGTLVKCHIERRQTCDGLELIDDRRHLAHRLTGATMYDKPLELLDIPANSFAPVFMINVFSHLISPTHTFARVREILTPGGVLLLRTGEIGPLVAQNHAHAWYLGDHLHWLGLDTIDRYAGKSGYTVVHHHRQWAPGVIYSRERLQVKGTSPVRNAVKSFIVAMPGLQPALSAYMRRHHLGNPTYLSTIVLRRTWLRESCSSV